MTGKPTTFWERLTQIDPYFGKLTAPKNSYLRKLYINNEGKPSVLANLFASLKTSFVGKYLDKIIFGEGSNNYPNIFVIAVLVLLLGPVILAGLVVAVAVVAPFLIVASLIVKAPTLALTLAALAVTPVIVVGKILQYALHVVTALPDLLVRKVFNFIDDIAHKEFKNAFANLFSIYDYNTEKENGFGESRGAHKTSIQVGLDLMKHEGVGFKILGAALFVLAIPTTLVKGVGWLVNKVVEVVAEKLFTVAFVAPGRILAKIADEPSAEEKGKLQENRAQPLDLPQTDLPKKYEGYIAKNKDRGVIARLLLSEEFASLDNRANSVVYPPQSYVSNPVARQQDKEQRMDLSKL